MFDELIFNPGKGYAKSIFVSSTFRDMQYERDMIASVVLPELSDFAAQYGASISFTDLRWGVNTGELDEIESARKVLSVCLDEIDASRPYMIVLLGDRYGWIPDSALLQKAAAEKGYVPDELQKSVTALEIEYGALAQQHLERCLFYFRNLPLDNMPADYATVYGAEDKGRAEKQKRLKEKIASAAPNRIRNYSALWDTQNNAVTGLEGLGEMICADVRAMMESEWGQVKDLTWQERSAMGFGLFLREKSAHCAGREVLVSTLQESLLQGGDELIVLRGASGSGKSTLMAALSQRLHSQGVPVLPFFCGNDARSVTVQDMLRQFIFYLETVLGHTKHFDLDCTATRAELTGEFRRLVRLYGESGKPVMVLMADALDRLQEDGLNHLGWLPLSVPSNIRFMLSCTDDFGLPTEMPGLRWQIREIGPLEQDGRQAVIHSLLRTGSKGLDRVVLKEIEALNGSENPLYLSVLIQRLVMLDNEDFSSIAKIGDNMEAINKYLIDIVRSMPQTVEGVCAAILQEAGERINAEFTDRITALLAASRYGLRKSDLEAILTGGGIAWSPLDFARFKKYMRGYFIERPDGRVDFSHITIRRGLSQSVDMQNAGKAVLAHLKKLPEDDPVRLTEIVYHAHRCDDRAFLADYLSHAGEKALDIAAMELRRVGLQSPGWFAGVIGEYAGKVPATFSAFVVFNYATAFDKSAQDYKTLRETFAALNRILQPKTDLESRRNLAILQNRLATIELAEGNPAGAEKLYAQSEQIALELSDKGYHPPEAPEGSRPVHISTDIGSAMINTAAALEAQGRLDEALSRYEKLLKTHEKMGKKLGKTAPRRDIVICCERIGSVYLQKKDPAKAIKYFQMGAAECPDLIAEEDNATTRTIAATINERLGNAYRAAGMLADAEKMYNLCLEHAKKSTLETGSVEARGMLGIAYQHLGVLAEIQGRNDSAMQLFADSLKIATALAEEADTSETWQQCSIAYERLANQQMLKHAYQDAYESYKKSLEISERLAKDSDSLIYQRDLSMGYHDMGTVCLAIGQLEESREYFAQDEQISGRLAEQLNTPSAYDEWAVAIYTLATHPAVYGAEKAMLLEKAGNIWKLLYRQTRYPDFMKKYESCMRMLN